MHSNELFQFEETAGGQPGPCGICAMLSRVDSFRAGHNIASLQALADALTKPDDVGEKARLMRVMREG